MARSTIVIWGMIWFLGGVAAMLLWREGSSVLSIVLLCGMCVLFVHGSIRSGGVDVARFLVMLVMVWSGLMRVVLMAEISGEEIVVREFEGCIVGEADVRRDKVKYHVEVDFMETLVLVNGPRYPVYGYGNCVRVMGAVKVPGQIEEFAYDRYLALSGVSHVVYRAQIEKVGEGEVSALWEMIYAFKGWFQSRLENIYGEPHASFMAGLLLGSRQGIPDDLMEDFSVTGLTHIIAVSGYNITLVVVVIGGLLQWMSRRMRVVCSVGAVVIFVMLVGAGPAVVRAGIMGIIGLMSVWYGRSYMVTVSLFVAALLMVAWNPLVLLFDAGFQLSFLATAGLVYLSPVVTRYVPVWVPAFLGIRESLTATLSAQIMVLPLVLFQFGILSLISPVVNMLVLPWIPLAMLCGFVSVMAGLLWESAGIFVGFLGYGVLEIMLVLVRLGARVPFAAVMVERFPWWLMVLCYAGFGWGKLRK